MNYMKEVTHMLGVELGEEFKIKYSSFNKYKITERGLEYFDSYDNKWYLSSPTLVELIRGDCKIIKLPKPILDEAEKEYLSNVIKPFKDTVKRIVKGYDFGKEFICIELEHGEIQLPYFESDTMYKGMEIYKYYTLEELGL